MRSLVIHIVHNSELFIASRALSSQPKFFLINHSLELRIVYGALTLRLRVIHVKHNLKQFIVSRALSSRPRVIYVLHSLEQFITSRALRSRLGVVYVDHNPMLFIASRPWVHDLESCMSFIALSLWCKIIHLIYNLELCITSKGLSYRDLKLFTSSIMLSSW